MSKHIKGWWLVGVAVVVAQAEFANAGENRRNFHAVNRFRIEYDDNIAQTETNEDDSVKLIEQIDLIYNLNLDQTFLSLRYEPSFVYWSDRDDDTDFHHAFDGSLSHAFNPRISLNLKDVFRFAERPELVERGSVVREENDYVYNSANATLSYLLRQGTRVEFSGRVVTLAYEEDFVANSQDYDIYVGGLTLRHTLRPNTVVFGEARYEDISYDEDARDSDTIYLGGGVEHTFNPSLLTSLRAGYQGRDFDQTERDSNDTPYVDASLTFLPSPATRISSGVSFSQYETDVSPFASQERTRVFVSIAHDLSARISAYLTGAYTNGDFDESETPTGGVQDGSEDIVLFSARATYKVNRANHLEVGYQLTDLDSDIRTDFTRNRVNLGWVLKL